MKIPSIRLTALFAVFTAVLTAAPDPQWLVHDRNRPLPPVVNPGIASTQE